MSIEISKPSKKHERKACLSKADAVGDDTATMTYSGIHPSD